MQIAPDEGPERVRAYRKKVSLSQSPDLRLPPHRKKRHGGVSIS
jgi:hypothetical protein